MVGPKYQAPPAPVPQAFKEPPPNGWKSAQPSDGVLRGKWWEVYNDPELNALEEQVSISNQNVLMAAAQYREAKDAIKIARAALYPTVTVGPGITSSSSSGALISVPGSTGTTGTVSSVGGGSNVISLTRWMSSGLCAGRFAPAWKPPKPTRRNWRISG
jgi:outer membrane protein TolC